jgi:hypothetical protein
MTLPKKTQILSSRHRYFQILIFLGFIASTAIMTQDLITLMAATEFIPQTKIERILDKLKIPDRGRLIGIEKFHGQLEKDRRTGLPYWNIYVTTQNLTTRKRLFDALLKKLQPTQDKIIKTAISTLEVHAVLSFHELEEKNRFLFPNTVWYPGFFSDQTVLFDKLLTNDDVEEVMKTYPEKYKEMLKDVFQ